MKVFRGKVETGNGLASGNLRHVISLIADRIGIPNIIDGTLNVRIDELYIVPAEAMIRPEEYEQPEILKLKRCRVRGVRSCIMRPHLHETVPKSEPSRR